MKLRIDIDMDKCAFDDDHPTGIIEALREYLARVEAVSPLDRTLVAGGVAVGKADVVDD